jgi:type I restriction enzyme, S subunit
VTGDWNETQLGELVEIKHGYAFKGEFFSEETTENLLLTPGNFSIGGGFQWGKQKFYDGPIPDDYILSDGDLVVTMTDLSKAADTLGYSALIPPSEKLLLHNQRIGKVIVKTNSVDVGYLNYQLRTKTYRNEVLASATGSTVKHTSPTKMCAYRFSLPPLAEQKSIASILGALDDKIENNRRMNETLEAMARAIFKSWFVDFDPVRAKAEGNQPAHMDAETAALFPSSFGDDGLPEGWCTVSLHTVSNIVYGKNLPTKNLIESGYPVFGGNGIIGFHTEYLYEEPQVLIACRGAASGKVLRSLPNSFVTNNSLIIELTESLLNRYFVELYLRHITLEKFTSGSAQPQMTIANMDAVKILQPTAELISSFSSYVARLFDKIMANDDENETLAKLRDTLLPKLMSGQIRVRDAEKEVEEVV